MPSLVHHHSLMWTHAGIISHADCHESSCEQYAGNALMINDFGIMLMLIAFMPPSRIIPLICADNSSMIIFVFMCSCLIMLLIKHQ